MSNDYVDVSATEAKRLIQELFEKEQYIENFDTETSLFFVFNYCAEILQQFDWPEKDLMEVVATTSHAPNQPHNEIH